MAEGQGPYKVGFKRLYVGVFNPEATKVVKCMTWEDEKGGTVDLKYHRFSTRFSRYVCI